MKFMKTYTLVGNTYEPFEVLRNVISEFCRSNGHFMGSESIGCGRGDHSKEAWLFQFIDKTGNEVLKYEYDNTTEIETYNGKLTINLQPSQEKILEKNISSLLRSLSGDRKEYPSSSTNP